GPGAGVAVVAGHPIGLGRVGARAAGRIASAHVVALIAGGTHDQVGAGAGAGLAGVSPGAGVAIVARRPIGLGRIGALARADVADASVVAWVAGRAHHWIGAGAGAGLAGVGPGAGVAVVASRAVRLGRVGAPPGALIARPHDVALILGAAD